jgi:heptaprenyl diphosphate synthase
MADLFAAGGKRLRPALVLLTAKLGEYDFERVAPAAMAVEMLHTATLVHDDVIDASELRRGRPTVAAARGAAAAIVIGDYYITRALRLAGASGEPQVADVLGGAMLDICTGELEQQASRHSYRIERARYLRRIELKTASLIAGACAMGGILGRLRPPAVDALRVFGRRLGVAFQVVDDVIDYLGEEADAGKPVGQDLREGHATLPLLLALEGPAGPDLETMLAEAGGVHGAGAERVIERVRGTGGVDAAMRFAAEEAAAARNSLSSFEPGNARAALEAMSRYLVSRSL